MLLNQSTKFDEECNVYTVLKYLSSPNISFTAKGKEGLHCVVRQQLNRVIQEDR